MFAICLAHAQEGLRLQRSLATPSGKGANLPTFLTADRIEGLGEFEAEAAGDAELRRGNASLTADRIRYFQDTDEAQATGDVRLRLGEDEMSGPRLRFRLEDSTGIFQEPHFHIAPRLTRQRLGGGPPLPQFSANESAPQVSVEGRGVAETLRFEGENRYRVTNASFTTCKPGQDDWFIEAEELSLDMDRQVGTARYAKLNFLGVSTPPIPWFDFSLSNDRKSGFLPPAVGAQGKTGFNVLVPYYWNIAPNYDATITPRYMARRGVQFLNEFRFLETWTRGELRYEYLPKDEVTGETRYAEAVNADWRLQGGWSGLINYQRVSDDNYFRDLAGRLSIATQVYLPQEVSVNYSPYGWWTAALRMQRFQTLQDPQNPVPEPYFREPQFTLSALKQTAGGVDAGFQGEFVDFKNSALVPTGSRAIAYPSVALPLTTSYGFLIPKIGVNATYYSLDSPSGFPDNSPSRILPIASLDSGLVFERGTNWLGRDVLQTFEPRLYYVYVPFKDQAQLPVFDTTTTDFNFAQLFQDNIFAGGDRIANANQLSVAATSRIVRSDDGQEIIRANIGQRYYFVDQKVTIPNQAVRTGSSSPLIVGLAGRVTPSWTAEAGVQYNYGSDQALEKVNAGVRYSPATASVASLAYRYTNQNFTAGAGTIRNIDAAAQWPLWRGLYGLGRLSYDLEGGQMVEQLLGLEYNAGCWVIRALAQEFATGAGQRTTLFYVQLELNGVARIGSNPLEVLRRSIPGYSLINQATPENRTIDFGPFGGGTSTPAAGPVVPIGATPLYP